MSHADPRVQRSILVVAHAYRDETVVAAERVVDALRAAGARPVLAADDRDELAAVRPALADVATLDDVPLEDIELAIVLGGDGTILRAAELVREGTAPVLGINMGHVGFLAEIERDDMDDAVRRAIERDYVIEERLALQVRVKDAADAVVYETWALNEATVEKANRERLLEVVIEVDERPLSTFGCDGVVVSTPTGSTAYNFSAGGPVIWPTVEAIVVVPLSAHALFAKPLVVGPEHSVAIELLERTNGQRRPVVRRAPVPRPASGCSRRRAALGPAGATRAAASGRVHRPARTQVPASGRWMAGPHGDAGRPAVIEEMRLRDLGVIAEATLSIGPGFTAITGETGAGKTMVVTGLGLLLGQRADSGAVRSGAAQASVDGVWIVPENGPVADRVREAGGSVEPLGDGTAELLVGRSVSSEGRGRATVGGRAAPAGVLADLADELVVVHGQSDQLRLRSATAQRDALDRFGGDPVQSVRDEYRAAFERWRAIERELAELTTAGDVRAAEAERLRAQLAEIEEAAPQPGEDADLATRAERLANAEELRLAAATAHDVLSGEGDVPDAGVLLAEARRALERAHDPALVDLAAQVADLGYRTADLAAALAAYLADLDESGPHELAAVEDRRAVIGALVRAHGTLDAAIDLLESGSARLAELDDDGDRIERLTAEREVAASALDAVAAALTSARTEAAERLGAAVTAELRDLAMPDARVTVAVTPGSETAAGRDDVALLLSPHSGAEPRPVARGASGGELSRVMLAIEVVIAGVDPVPTFVFDEVDAGIGGAAAIEVGRRLARLAEASQVIAVTHLAQVAAFANNHLTVVKASDGSVTASNVRRLEGAEREAEMARLLSGLTDSDAALTHARELLSIGGSAA